MVRSSNRGDDLWKCVCCQDDSIWPSSDLLWDSCQAPYRIGIPTQDLTWQHWCSKAFVSMDRTHTLRGTEKSPIIIFMNQGFDSETSCHTSDIPTGEQTWIYSCTNWSTRGLLLLHDNARSHILTQTLNFLNSLDLAPCDFYFPDMQIKLSWMTRTPVSPLKVIILNTRER